MGYEAAGELSFTLADWRGQEKILVFLSAMYVMTCRLSSLFAEKQEAIYATGCRGISDRAFGASHNPRLSSSN